MILGVPLLIEIPSLGETLDAQLLQKLHDASSKTQWISLQSAKGTRQIGLKLECDLPFGSYKIRGVINAIERFRKRYLSNPSRLETISAGNMAQVLAAKGQELGVPVHAVVPDSAPRVKTDVIEKLGAHLKRLPMNEVWQMVQNPSIPKDGLLIHPVFTPGILAGYGVIALEILSLNPRPDAVFIPFGVGGLTLGIASVLKQIDPSIDIICVETAACPSLESALLAGRPVAVKKQTTCVDAIGTPSVLDEVFEIIRDRNLVRDVNVVEESKTQDAIRFLYKSHGIITEGAAAACFAAANDSSYLRPLAVLTGRNINPEAFRNILDKDFNYV